MSVKIGRNDPCWCGSGRKYKACHEAFDEKIARYASQGHIVPQRNIIKNAEQIAGIKESCKIIIVLHFLRTAIGTQTAPPNQVLIALALFLTFFIMWPTFQQINTEAIQPLDKGEITTEEAFTVAQGPIREFMYGQTQEKDLKLFVDISDETYDSYDDVPMTTLIPAFILSELRAAFIIGFVIYIPFIVIDMVVASVLMSMGMMMLPPTTISLPFKILLFILADGWDLVIGSLVKTFY